MESASITDQIRCYRPVIAGRHGAVAANHPLAAQAGLMVLRQGGNAVDAAVATALALGVVEPMMSGLGGDGFYQVFEAKTGKSVVFNGTGPAPGPRSRTLRHRHNRGTGPLSASVPGMLAGLGEMHRHYGSLPWALRLCDEAWRWLAMVSGQPRITGTSVPTMWPPWRRTSAVGQCSFVLARHLGWGHLSSSLERPAALEEIAAGGAEVFYRGAWPNNSP